MTDEERTQFELWSTPPPAWLAFLQWVATGILALTGALVIMVQWMVWFIWTSQFLSGWGMGFGIVVVAAQILWMFDPRKEGKDSRAL